MRVEVISVEYTAHGFDPEPLRRTRSQQTDRALRVRLAGGKFLFVSVDPYNSEAVKVELLPRAVPRWGDNPKLTVLKEVEVSQQVVGYWVAVAVVHDQATKRCLELLK